MCVNSQAPLYLPLHSKKTTVELVGGKGHSLARLMNLKIPVPQGFLLTTAAYRQFVYANSLQAKIVEIITKIEQQKRDTINTEMAEIRTLFAAANLPSQILQTLQTAYVELGGDITGEDSVAVRSSATAEDLPEMSFAGQHDTYLNVVGFAALHKAILDCWCSLWTTRAFSYREHMGIDHLQVAMGVVVQEMVPAEVSGVLFTANPADGNLTEMVINANYGLGESIVGGHVIPDTYVVHRHNGIIRESSIAKKERMTVSTVGQGIETQVVPEAQRHSTTLSEKLIQELVFTGNIIEQYFNAPQDIEWAFDKGNHWILQSRPITNLPVVPMTDVQWQPPRQGAKLLRRQVVEHMPGPLSPLFEDLYLLQGMNRSMDTFLEKFGVDFDLGEMLHFPFFVTVNGYAYSSIDMKFNWKIVPRVALLYVKMLPKLLRNAVPRWQNTQLPAYLTIIDRWKKLDTERASNAQLFSGIQELSIADAVYWFDVSIILGLSKVTDNLLNSFLQKFGNNQGLTSGLFLRGFASKTLEAQEEMEAIALKIQNSPPLAKQVLETPAAHLMHALQEPANTEVAKDVLQKLQAYLEKYGHRVYTLDFVEPTQGEDRLPVFLALKALIQKTKDSSKRKTDLAQQRDDLTQEISQTFGPIRRWCFHKLLGWAQKYGPYREEAIFYIGAAWPTLRHLAKELGQHLVIKGILQKPDDIYYLRQAEVERALVAPVDQQGLPEYQKLTQERRALREAQKLLTPPTRIPDVPFKLGPFNLSMFEPQKQNENSTETLRGFTVSPGTITGPATVVLSPKDFDKMQPGTILVCPTTTPAWTPLFSQAIGLVTEIGGILAHGSIVAREYGIPAVMGVAKATRKIKNGQMIAVDGNTGIVRIVEE